MQCCSVLDVTSANVATTAAREAFYAAVAQDPRDGVTHLVDLAAIISIFRVEMLFKDDFAAACRALRAAFLTRAPAAAAAGLRAAACVDCGSVDADEAATLCDGLARAVEGTADAAVLQDAVQAMLLMSDAPATQAAAVAVLSRLPPDTVLVAATASLAVFRGLAPLLGRSPACAMFVAAFARLTVLRAPSIDRGRPAPVCAACAACDKGVAVQQLVAAGQSALAATLDARVGGGVASMGVALARLIRLLPTSS